VTMETVLVRSDRVTYPWYHKYPGIAVWVMITWSIQHYRVDSLWNLFWSVPLGFAAGAACSGFWWLDNDEDPDKGFVYRYLRNNLMNFKRFVVGVADRDHCVTGKIPATCVIRSDLVDYHAPDRTFYQLGWQYALIHVFGVPLLPWISYAGPRVEWYAGWQPWGELAFKWNLRNSNMQVL
jgi:hypothetical protein